MLVVLQVEQSPHLVITLHYHVAAASPVAPIWSAFWDEFLAAQMRATCPSVPRAAEDLDIVDKVALGHTLTL